MQLPRSHGRKTVSVQRGLMMLCSACYDSIHEENLVDKKTMWRIMRPFLT